MNLTNDTYDVPEFGPHGVVKFDFGALGVGLLGGDRIFVEKVALFSYFRNLLLNPFDLLFAKLSTTKYGNI